MLSWRALEATASIQYIAAKYTSEVTGVMWRRLYVTPTDVNQIPNGELAAVQGSPFDFTTPRPIGERIGAVHPPHPPAAALVETQLDKSW